MDSSVCRRIRRSGLAVNDSETVLNLNRLDSNTPTNKERTRGPESMMSLNVHFVPNRNDRRTVKNVA